MGDLEVLSLGTHFSANPDLLDVKNSHLQQFGWINWPYHNYFQSHLVFYTQLLLVPILDRISVWYSWNVVQELILINIMT